MCDVFSRKILDTKDDRTRVSMFSRLLYVFNTASSNVV